MTGTLIAVKACVFFLDGTCAYGTLTAAMNKLLGGEVRRTTPKFEVEYQGDVYARAHAGPRDSVEFEILLTSDGTTNTIANAKGNLVLPAGGATVTIASSGLGTFDGTWNATGDATVSPGERGLILRISCDRVGAVSGNNPTLLSAVS